MSRQLDYGDLKSLRTLLPFQLWDIDYLFPEFTASKLSNSEGQFIMQYDSGIFFIHIMKTAGTSLRKMLTDSLDESLTYPNDRDLQKSPHRHYPSLSNILSQMQSGELRKFKILCGHYPFFLGEMVFKNPRYIVFLREPVARTISMIEHRKWKTPAFRYLSYEEILDNEDFVKKQLENYQTKVFALSDIEQCGGDTNIPLEITPENFKLALERLEKVDVIGTTENFNKSIELIEKKFGFEFKKRLYTNRGAKSDHISKKESGKALLLET